MTNKELKQKFNGFVLTDRNTETTVAATQLYSHLTAKVRINSHQVEFNWCR